MASKNKYYVVWEGYEIGIFDSWNACKRVVHGYPTAKYKGFPTLQEAQKALKGRYDDYKGKKISPITLSPTELQRIGKPITPSISVDAACSGNPGIMEYRGVNTKDGNEIFRIGPFAQGTNNIGEFLALVHALALLKKKQLNIPIYSDSQIAINWIRLKKCKTKNKPTAANEKIFELIDRAETWLNENTFSNRILKWETKAWGEIPADFGRKS
ncbi:viroplasmin family protein [Capnocytophaga canimorsus]|uniref:ribonuclease H1 domain-containing protein n=1 Tax=Capnocytophaga canimorsus TaxID=28188 RepID=UPI0037D2F575